MSVILETRKIYDGSDEIQLRVIPHDEDSMREALAFLDEAAVMQIHSRAVLCRDDTLCLRQLRDGKTAYPYVITVSSSGEPHLGVCIYGETVSALEQAAMEYIKLQQRIHRQKSLFYFYNKDGRSERFHRDGLTPRLMKRMFSETTALYRFRDCVFDMPQSHVLGANYGPILYLACCEFATIDCEYEFLRAMTENVNIPRRECYIYQDLFESEDVFLKFVQLQQKRSLFPIKFTLDLLTIPASVCIALAAVKTQFLELRNNRLIAASAFCDNLLSEPEGPQGLGLQHTFSFGSRQSGWCQLLPGLVGDPRCRLKRLDIGFWVDDDDSNRSKAWIQALQKNSRLQNLNFKFWNIPDWDALKKAMINLKSLRRLTLQVKDSESDERYLELMRDIVNTNDNIEFVDHGGLQTEAAKKLWDRWITRKLQYNEVQKRVLQLHQAACRDGLLAPYLSRAATPELFSMTLRHHLDIVLECVKS